MVAFDWVSFLEHEGIEYVTQGANVARGHVNIACPFCGDDPSHHLGISLEKGWWGCWRDRSHRSKDQARLLAALARCSIGAAREIIGTSQSFAAIDLEQLELELFEKELGQVEEVKPLPRIPWPRACFKLDRRKEAKPFLAYIKKRGFEDPAQVAHRYKLRGSWSGGHKCRVLFPLFSSGHLVGWTGRAIVDSTRRYKAHPEGKGVLRLLWNDTASLRKGGKLLVVCEGPVDALKLDYFGRSLGARAVALMGLDFNSHRVTRILELSQRFGSLLLLFDAEAQAEALDAHAELRIAGPILGELPRGRKDPGELSAGEVRKLLRRILAGSRAA